VHGVGANITKDSRHHHLKMDDDLTFGTSVWGMSEEVDGTPLPLNTVPFILPSSDLQQDNDPFDDFNDPTESNPDAADDDFGDFGDFGQAEIVNLTGFEDDIGFGEEVPVAGPSSHREWHPLKLDPLPPPSELAQQVNEILEPIWGYGDTSGILTDEGIRDVEGISQILVTSERYLISPAYICLVLLNDIVVICTRNSLNHHRR
jgi:Domain of unknown function (DUF5102)